MAQISESPRLPQKRGPGRPPRDRQSTTVDLGPPQKKLRYIPGGPGGGGRYVDDDGNITPMVVGSTPGTYGGSRSRSSRGQRESHARTPTVGRPRRDRSQPTSSRNRETSTADAAASHIAQSNDNKPREERGWEEYHPDLDLGADLTLLRADEVDGRVRPADLSCALETISVDKQKTPTGNASAQANGDDEKTPTRQIASAAEEPIPTPQLLTPVKRGPGRPPRRPQAMLHGLGSPPTPRIEPLPVNNKEEKLRLTKATFRIVRTYEKFETSKEHSAKNFVDKTLSSFGYQETDRVLEPDKYEFVRAGEGSIEEELDLQMARDVEEECDSGGAVVGRVEYDMDEQDEFWLDDINSRRREDQLEAIKPAHFEVTMTQIEKEWHALEKRIPKHNPKSAQTRPRSSSAAAVIGEQEAQEDQACAICDDGDCDNSNAILFCDGCDLAVHQECYGVPFVPEGQWLCRKCQHYGRTSPRCVFCPHNDGAFKQTTNAKWAHLLCAIWIPEVSLGNSTFMEPIMDVEKVPKQRWGLRCYICQQKWGACIQCGNKTCFAAFHVTCARKSRLFLKMKSQHGGPERMDASALKAYCDRHVPSDWKRENDVPNALADAKEYFREQFRGMRWGDAQNTALTSTSIEHFGVPKDVEEQIGAPKRKGEKAPKNIWRLPSGAPVVPQIVYGKVEGSLVRFNIRKRKDYVAEASKYWTLKREARRGAALLKRLQMQRDTYSAMDITRRNFAAMGAIGRVRLHNRIDFAELLEKDMDRVLEMCNLVLKREQDKADDAHVLQKIVETTYFPLSPKLWEILEKAQQLDAGAKDDGPKYFKNGLRDLQTKLEEHVYVSVAPFCVDFVQVFSTAVLTLPSEDMGPDDSTLSQRLSLIQKEIKKVAKRIVHRVKDMILDAQRIEAELNGRPLEGDWIDLDGMLESDLRARRGSVIASVDGSVITEDPASPSAKRLVNGYAAPVSHPSDNATLAPVEVSNGNLTNGEIVMHGARGHTVNGEHRDNDKDETTDDAVVRIQIRPGSNTIPIINTGDDAGLTNVQNGGFVSSTSSTATGPALSASGSTHPSTHAPEPLTPPEQQPGIDTADNALPTSVEGGVPWYLEAFEPRGTTIHEERWSGRDIMRSMSEDLSELSEEDLANLLDADVIQDGLRNGHSGNANLAPPVAPDESRKKMLERKKDRARKRRKLGWGR